MGTGFLLSNLANNITILRILLVPAFIGCLLYYRPGNEGFRIAAIVIFVFACVTDALDGYIARKYNQITALGSYIDPIADKLLLVSGFLCLSLAPNIPDWMKIPAWVTLSVISRDVIILIGSTLIFVSTGTLKAKPLFVGKVTTVLQMATLFGVLAGTPQSIGSILFILTTFFTALSGYFYIRLGEQSFS